MQIKTVASLPAAQPWSFWQGSKCCCLTPLYHFVINKPCCAWQGVGKQLVQHCVDHLKSINCTEVILHASNKGAQLYPPMGFKLQDSILEMKLQVAEPLKFA